MREWRNWQTHWTQNPAPLKREGSTPSSRILLYNRLKTGYIREFEKQGVEQELRQNLNDFIFRNLIEVRFLKIKYFGRSECRTEVSGATSARERRWDDSLKIVSEICSIVDFGLWR